MYKVACNNSISLFPSETQAAQLLRQCKFLQEPNYKTLEHAFRDIQAVSFMCPPRSDFRQRPLSGGMTRKCFGCMLPIMGLMTARAVSGAALFREKSRQYLSQVGLRLSALCSLVVCTARYLSRALLRMKPSLFLTDR